MSKADLGIVPKRAAGFGDEAFSTKILEFMALGVPVIASETQIDRYYFTIHWLGFSSRKMKKTWRGPFWQLPGTSPSENNWQPMPCSLLAKTTGTRNKISTTI